MRTLTVLLALAFQASSPSPLAAVRQTLRQLGEHVDEHRLTAGATAELTGAKHQFRDWIESRLAGFDQMIDPSAFQDVLHAGVKEAGLLCDDCEPSYLGYVDDVRVTRTSGYLIIVTSMGIYCGYDESAYAYAWDNGQWRRIWEHEQNTYVPAQYQPLQVHDVQISSPDAAGGRLLMLLGSQTICGGAFKDLYARVWHVDAAFQTAQVLDWKEFGNDGIPPIDGRVLPDDVLFKFTADGRLDGDPHTAIRRFHVAEGKATAIDPIAGRPLDFVLEWLDAPWEVARTRSDASGASLESQHAALRRTDRAGDFPQPTLRCTSGEDLWQVTTHLYEGPTRYYRVRWREPYQFTMIAISEAAFPDCTVRDPHGDAFTNVLAIR